MHLGGRVLLGDDGASVGLFLEHVVPKGKRPRRQMNAKHANGANLHQAQHAIHWHWPIPAYVVTKHIAGGAAVLLALAALMGWLPASSGLMVAVGGVALVALFVTLVLLVYDLDRPDRFFYLLLRPQWSSWIARAAWILTAFSLVLFGWWAVEALSLIHI